jgi:CMP-N,N'-diacetyllegionaminic acid synthase
MRSRNKIMCATRLLVVIPVRLGSKRVPRKNLRKIGGKSLLDRTIDCAADVVDAFGGSTVDVVITTESQMIIDEVKNNYGEKDWLYFIKRPYALAQDDVTLLPVVTHAITDVKQQNSSEYTSIVLLQCTSPLRRALDVIKCIEKQLESNCGSVLSVVRTSASPYSNIVEMDQNNRIRIVCSHDGEPVQLQSVPITYEINGAVYVWDAKRFMNNQKHLYHDTKIYEMDSKYSIDIDTEIDLKIASVLIEESGVEED